MNKNLLEKDVKKALVDFTTKSVQSFLNEHPKLRFYAFAYDCNAEYAGVGICFNTKEAFNETLKHYQEGPYAKHYQAQEDIEDLKFNTGDWEYQCFDTIDLLSDEELTRIYNQLPEDNYVSWNNFLEELMEIFCEALIEFTYTKVYQSIPKTDDFCVFCIDHDEDLSDAKARMQKVEAKMVKRKGL